MTERPEASGDTSVLLDRAFRRAEDELVLADPTLLLSLKEMARGELIDITPQADN